ncbi:ankyrin repeat-containing domain protein [Chytriomyces sp. MP71]|nr:ankyrin repeat-containing domain protein [Chytriomyces sp. MP71]
MKRLSSPRNLLTLPAEVLDEICAHLPIEDGSIVRLGLAGKSRVTVQVLSGTKIAFALRHFDAQSGRATGDAFWSFLDEHNLKWISEESGPPGTVTQQEQGAWHRLPRTYKAAIYLRIMQAEEWSRKDDETVPANLMAYSRFPLGENAVWITHRILETGLDPTVSENRLLRWACRSGYLGVVRELFEIEGVRADDDDQYCIKTAAETGRLEIVRMLLARPEVDPSHEGNIAVMYACDQGHSDVVKCLLEYVDSQDKRPVDPRCDDDYCFKRAVANDDLDLLRVLTERALEILASHGTSHSSKSSVFTTETQSCLMGTMSVQGSHRALQYLVSLHLVDPSLEENQAIINASFYGHSKVLRILLSLPGEGPAVDHSQPLIYACERGHIDCVRLLLEDGRVDPVAQDYNAFYEACRQGYLEIVSLFLDNEKISPDECLKEALREGCQFGKLALVQLLLDCPRISDYTVLLDECLDEVAATAAAETREGNSDSNLKADLAELESYLMEKKQFWRITSHE